MKSVTELGQDIKETLEVDSAMRKAIAGLLTINPQFFNPGAEEVVYSLTAEALKNITQKNLNILEGSLAELAQHDSPDAVKGIQRLFRAKVMAYRLLAITILATMSTTAATRAIAKRASFWSFASKEERNFVKELLKGNGQAACASCAKFLRPFPVSSGPWTGTVSELSQLKLEANHGFVCEACGAVVCPVCAGRKASELGVHEFVCTQCGARPLKTIYRSR